MKREISCKISGVTGLEANGAINIDYVYITGGVKENGDTVSPFSSRENVANKISYDDLSAWAPNILGFNYICNSESTEAFKTDSPEYGIYKNSDKIIYPYSIYRREYVPNPNNINDPYYIGEWEPVKIQSDDGYVRDYNIQSHRQYQYVLYPLTWGPPVYANDGESISAIFNCWSLTELLPIDLNLQINTPTIKKTYTVDENNVWLFKYNPEFGSQTQNTAKTEQATLGQFSRFSHGIKNNLSGSVSALLGSEIIPYSDTKYVERLRNSSTVAPLTSNQRIQMLEKWRHIVYSKNPKLLKDMKGQSWIVQIYGGTNTPKQYVKGMPDTISFTWTQIEDVDNIVITGPIADLRSTDYPEDSIARNWNK